jgi:hypothetical protein
VVVSADERERKASRVGNLAWFFASSTMWDSGLVIERVEDEPEDPQLSSRYGSLADPVSKTMPVRRMWYDQWS